MHSIGIIWLFASVKSTLVALIVVRLIAFYTPATIIVTAYFVPTHLNAFSVFFSQ